jgi:hypothetical protein
MHAQNFFIDQCTNRQAVKDIREYLPEFNGVAALALIVETVNSVNLGTFVISSEQEEVFRIFYFVTK